MAKRKYRLKNVKIREVSLVGHPAFGESEWLILKSLAVKFDSLSFAGKPLHPWTSVEVLDQDDLTLLVSGIVLAEGDAKPDGGKFTLEEIESLQQLWARRYAKREKQNLGWSKFHYIQEGNEGNFDTLVVGFGMSGDKDGLSLMGMGDKTLPKNAWFVQLQIGNEHGTASKIVGNKKSLNGLRLVGPAILTKGEVEKDSDDLMDLCLDAIIEGVDESPIIISDEKLVEIIATKVREAAGPDDTPDGFESEVQVELVDPEAFVASVADEVVRQGEPAVLVDMEELTKEAMSELEVESAADTKAEAPITFLSEEERLRIDANKIVEIDLDELEAQARREVLAEAEAGGS